MTEKKKKEKKREMEGGEKECASERERQGR
jgi:hypothetical protein